MRYVLTIPGVLPGLNEYTKACRGNKYAGAEVKKIAEGKIGRAIAEQLPGVVVKTPVRLYFTWYVPNKRRDRDNIQFAKKFVQDALVRCRVIVDDSWDWVLVSQDTAVLVDRENPRTIVLVEEVKEEYKMGFICQECGVKVEQEDLKLVTEPHGEEWTVCPNCGGDDLAESHCCGLCGEELPEDDLNESDMGYYCGDCSKRITTKLHQVFTPRELAILDVLYDGESLCP